jgi:hypothetical protein
MRSKSCRSGDANHIAAVEPVEVTRLTGLQRKTFAVTATHGVAGTVALEKLGGISRRFAQLQSESRSVVF